MTEQERQNRAASRLASAAIQFWHDSRALSIAGFDFTLVDDKRVHVCVQRLETGVILTATQQPRT